MRAHAVVLLALLVAPAVGAALPLAEAQAAAPVVTVTAVRSGYALDSWKDESATAGVVFGPTAFPVLPFGYTGVYANPYAGPARHAGPGVTPFWGYALALDVAVTDASGQPALGEFVLSATLETPHGLVPVKLTKRSGSTFTAQFDLDGEAGRRDVPVVRAGDHVVRLAVAPADPDPRAAPAAVANATWAFTWTPGVIEKPAFTLPEATLPGYADVGAGNVTRVNAQQVAPNATYSGAGVFATSGVPVGQAAGRVTVVGPNGARVVWNGSTDAQGRAPFTFQPSALLRPAPSGLLIVAAELVAATNASGPVLGSTVLAVPAATATASIVGERFEDRGDPRFNSVLVSVVDVGANPPASGAQRGVLHAVKGDAVLTSATFTPDSFLSGEERTVRFPASAVTRFNGLEAYGLVVFLLTGNGGLHAFATASRGVAIEAPDVSVGTTDQAAYRLLVRNLNENVNGAVDPGLEMTVNVTITGLPGGDISRDVTVAEGGVTRVDVPLEAPRRVGMKAIAVTAVAGELTVTRSAALTVSAPAGAFESFLAGIPAAPPAGLLIVLVALAVALRRRTA